MKIDDKNHINDINNLSGTFFGYKNNGAEFFINIYMGEITDFGTCPLCNPFGLFSHYLGHISIVLLG